ncbi:aminomethyltransferase beta-barrel domain-containing protein [Thermodesulfobacteriota bacterium]
MNWISGKEPDLPCDFLTKIRYRHEGAPAHVLPFAKGHYRVRFHEQQLAITPGQFAVFYEGDKVVGGGVIL